MRDIASMKAFVAVVENGGISTAGQELNLTPSAVSKQVSRLEEDVGVRLLNRSTHGLYLTEVGRIFYDHCIQILRAIEVARDAAREANATLTGTLKLHVTPGTGQQVVFPFLNSFMVDHPSLTIDLIIEPAALDVFQNSLDLSIRSCTDGELPLQYTSVDCVHLANAQYAVCATKEYLKRYGRPNMPRNLIDHRCLVYAGQPSSDKWWFRNGDERYAVNISGKFRVNDWSMMYGALRAGIGIARLLTVDSMRKSLLSGLEQIFREETITERSVWALYPRSRHMPQKTKAFLDYLRACLAGESAAQVRISNLEK